MVLAIGSMVGSTFGLTVGSMVGSTWPCWAINLSKEFDNSDKRLNELVVLQTCFAGFIKQTRRFTGSLMAILIVTRPYRG